MTLSFRMCLGLFLLAVCFPNIETARAALDAYVKSEKAIIYADPALKIKLGFVPKGKMIKVGDHPKGEKLKIYPIIVEGKVAYILALDLQFPSEADLEVQKQDLLLEQKYRDQERIKNAENDRKIKNIINKKISLQYSLLQPGKSWTKFSSSIANKGFLHSWNGQKIQAGLELWFFENWTPQAGVQYLLMKEKDITYKASGYHVGLVYHLLETETNYRYELSASYHFYSHATLAFMENSLEHKLHGLEVAITAQKELQYHWIIKYGLGYHIFKTKGIYRKVNFNNQYNVTINELTLQGLQLMVGIIFRL